MTNVSLPPSESSSDPNLEECHYLKTFVWQKTYLSEHTNRNLVALICVNSLAIIPTILLNALVIFVVATRRRLQTTSNILLASLAGTDVLSGLVVQPIAIAVEVKRALGVQPFCTLETVRAIALYAQSFASLNHIVLVSIDRYIAVKDALRYQGIVTKARIKKVVSVAWTIAVVLEIQEIVMAAMDSGSKFYSVYWTLTEVLLVAVNLACIGGICYCYVYIFSESRRQRNRLQTAQLSHEEAKQMRKDNKAAHTLAIILGALIISYLPSIILLLVIETFSNDALNPSVTPIFSSWASTSVLLNSLASPIIYCWRNKKFRSAFLEICHVRQPENRAPAIKMTAIQRHRPEIQLSTYEAFSMTVANQEPLLLSFSHLKAKEMAQIEEINC